jgi:hypothetical protein
MRLRLDATVAALCLALPGTGVAQSLVLDADDTRVLVATPRPAPVGTDLPLRMSVELRRGGARVSSALDAEMWRFARLLPGDRFLGVTPTGELWLSGLADAPDAPAVFVDEGVTGAVSTSPDGRHLVYCRGDGPDAEVFRADDGRVRAVTTGMAPVWSPAISPDGRAVVFVSAASGVPALYRVDADAPPRQLTNVGVRARPGVVPALAPYPDAMTPPLLGRVFLVFESRGRVHVLDADGRPLQVHSQAASPFWFGGEVDGRLGVFRPGRVSPEVLDLPRPRAGGPQ